RACLPPLRRHELKDLEKYTPTSRASICPHRVACYSRRTWLARASPPRKETLMDERQIRDLIEDVRAGRLSRRAFTRLMIGLGLTGPLAAQMLGAAGVAAQPRADGFTPTRRGGGGLLK